MNDNTPFVHVENVTIHLHLNVQPADEQPIVDVGVDPAFAPEQPTVATPVNDAPDTPETAPASVGAAEEGGPFIVVSADRDSGASGGYSVVRPRSSVLHSRREFDEAIDEASEAVDDGEIDSVLAYSPAGNLFVNFYTDTNTFGRTVHASRTKAAQYAESNRPVTVYPVQVVR